MTNQDLKNTTIVIVAGEGCCGTVKSYTGKKTLQALKMRLTKERCGGDRWAYAKIDGAKSKLPRQGGQPG